MVENMVAKILFLGILKGLQIESGWIYFLPCGDICIAGEACLLMVLMVL